MQVRPNIVSREPFTGYKTKGIKVDEFYVRGTIGFCNDDRTEELYKIAGLLGVPLIVERVERKLKPSKILGAIKSSIKSKF